MTEDYFVRLWVNRTEIPEDFTKEEKTLRVISKLRGYKPSDLIEKISEIVPNLNAIEIKDGGCGVVAYLTDFNTDIHG